MAALKKVKVDTTRLVRAARTLVGLPLNHFTVDYDAGADVLYISYVKPQRATDSEMLETGVIVNRRRGQVVGVTILDASKR